MEAALTRLVLLAYSATLLRDCYQRFFACTLQRDALMPCQVLSFLVRIHAAVFVVDTKHLQQALAQNDKSPDMILTLPSRHGRHALCVSLGTTSPPYLGSKSTLAHDFIVSSQLKSALASSKFPVRTRALKQSPTLCQHSTLLRRRMSSRNCLFGMSSITRSP